jgi:hypothetical protein
MKKKCNKLFNTIILITITLIVLVFSYCKEESNQERHSYFNYYEGNKEKARMLLGEYKAKMFDCLDYQSVLKNNTLIDSTIVNFSQKGDSFYLKALIRNNCGNKFYATLKCPKKLFDDYKHSRSNHAYLVISINKIDETSTIAEADTLDKNTKNIRIDNSIMLTGNCLALREIPDYSPVY